MEYVAVGIIVVAALAVYAAVIPYRRDFESMVKKLEKQTQTRIRLY